jgi:hypothetical protein
MRTLYVAFLVSIHLLSLGLAIYTTWDSGVPVPILLYAFLIDYVLRLGTIQLLHAAMLTGRDGVVFALTPYISQLPGRGQHSHPVREGEHGPPARLGIYLLVLLVCAYFAFVLMNVNADRQIDFTTIGSVLDLKWALLIGVVYWANALLARTIVIHPAEPVTWNFGYNSKEVTILALAVLTGSVVVAVRQGINLDASPWTVMGPLLFFRFVFDLSASLRRIGHP